MDDLITGMDPTKEKLNQFKDYAVSHPHLALGRSSIDAGHQ